jgi:argininosuccinate lyase
MSEKTWDGRFSDKTDPSVEAFTSSIDIDKRLYSYDIEGSLAHLKMLAENSIITQKDASLLSQGLAAIKEEIKKGKFKFDDSMEDIHMHIETALVNKVGKVALKLHTARSRNDQVALDVRMYLRQEVYNILKLITKLNEMLVNFAEINLGVILPGYTHTQRAQPVLFSHHLMAYYEMFLRDAERFSDSLKRINVMPLGSAALAGTTYPIDRNLTAELLDFSKVSANSMDAVSDRDFIIEFLSCASICMVHFSRLSEELILWSSSEFGFIELPDSFATGSSIMPQKKNPDVPELVRGKTSRVFGDLMAMLSMMKSLPLSYNRDMQEDKVVLFDAVDILKACLDIYIKMLPKIKINKEQMEKAASQGFLNATDLADYLTVKGMPFREAHACAGKAVKYALDNKKELHELSIKELQTFSSNIKEDIFKFLDKKEMVDRRKSAGGTSTKNVKAAIVKAQKNLEKEMHRL